MEEAPAELDSEVAIGLVLGGKIRWDPAGASVDLPAFGYVAYNCQ